jgi:hypothetical protein
MLVEGAGRMSRENWLWRWAGREKASNEVTPDRLSVGHGVARELLK